MIFKCFLVAIAASAISAQEPLYKDPSAPVEQRVEDLLSRMTLSEKLEQISMCSLGEYPSAGATYGVCHSPFVSVEEVARQSAAAKKYAFEGTRLGIPPFQIAECLHGLLSYGATIFPQSIAQGSTWNPSLVREMAEAIAEEASSVGVDQALSPVFDLIRDPRYGRNEECYSEDPLLAGTMGSSFVKGMQGDKAEKLPKGKVACTAKHFAGYSQPQGGMNLAPASIGEREMRSFHLVPFEMAVKDAGIYGVMPAYNDVDDIPAHANKALLKDLLRDEWGFEGYTFSDYGGVSLLADFHHLAASHEEAGLMALDAGVDLEAAAPDCYMKLEGIVDEILVDEAVRHILTAKFRAGLFEKPYADVSDIKHRVHTAEHINLSRKVAEESVILLKNEGALLPLDKSKISSIAVVGPNADRVQYGDYSYTRDNASGVTVLQGIKEFVGNDVKVNYARGCGISSLDKSGIREAVKAARKSDVTVCVLGGTSVILSGLGWGLGPGENEDDEPFTCGEGYDLTDINPLGVQRDLIEALVGTGKPVILVLVHGRPWSISWEKDNVPAILEAWYPGEQGGAAIADILFGEVNPSGRLSCTIPQSVGHIPSWYCYKSTSRGINREPGSPEQAGRDYVFSSPEPLFCFGHGLSYTDFEYSNLEFSSDTFGAEGLDIEVVVKNTGAREGKEVVQLYYNDVVSSVSTPVVRLCAFEKISLDAGESRKVTFHINPSDLALWDKDMKKVTEPGEFKFMLGRSSEDIIISKSAYYK